MADQDYWDWYAKAFGSQPQKAPEVLPQVSDWDAFYRSVGINPTGVGGAPSTRTVQSVPVQRKTAPQPASVEDRVTARNKAPLESALERLTASYGAPQGAETIARYQTPSVSDYVRGKSGQPIPDRLSASPGIPANFGGLSPQQVAQIGLGLSEEVNPAGLRVTAPVDPLRILVDGANPIQTAQKVAPVPFPPYRQVGSSLSVPAPAPAAIAPQPMQRPQMQQAPMAQQIQQVQQRVAPVPMPASMRPQQQGMGIFGSSLPSWTNSLAGRTNVIDAALKKTFNGNSPQQQQQQQNLVAEALRNSIPQNGAGQSPTYQDLGNGKFQDNLGGVYFTRNL